MYSEALGYPLNALVLEIKESHESKYVQLAAEFSKKLTPKMLTYHKQPGKSKT